MTDQQKLKELIELAVKNGWEGYWKDLPEVGVPCEAYSSESDDICRATLLFDHEFCKAIFGEQPACGNPCCDICPGIWTHKISDLAITKPEERISYAWDNRRKE